MSLLRAIAAAMLLPVALEAQALRGTVLDSASQRPLPGVAIMLLDASGRSIARTVSDAKGGFRAPSLPVVRIRFQRIGYRPRTISIPASGELTLSMQSLPTLLDTVAVKDQPTCPRRPDRARALALWEQARSALLASVIQRDERPADVLRLQYYRIVGEARDGVLSQTVEGEWVHSTRPYGARFTAADFIATGFHSDSGGERTFFAPDADVLLEDAFTTAYCFHLAAGDASRPELAGLAFLPAHTKPDRTDVSGVLWTDTVARQLRNIEFRFLGVDKAASALDVGGYVHFATLPNAVPLLDYWSIRLLASAADSAKGPRVKRPNIAGYVRASYEVHEIGGEVARLQWNDSTFWQAGLNSVRGRLMFKGRPVADTIVKLVGTNYGARTDSNGAFRIDNVAPGRYTFAIPDSGMNAHGLEMTRGQSFTVGRGDTLDIEVEKPVAQDWINARCPRVDRSQARSALVGRIRDLNGEFTEAAVTVHQGRRASLGMNGDDVWRRIYETKAAVPSMWYSAYDGVTGVDGMFIMCKVPSLATFRVDASQYGQAGTALFETGREATGIFIVEIRMRRVP